MRSFLFRKSRRPIKGCEILLTSIEDALITYAVLSSTYPAVENICRICKVQSIKAISEQNHLILMCRIQNMSVYLH